MYLDTGQYDSQYGQYDDTNDDDVDQGICRHDEDFDPPTELSNCYL